MKCLLCSPALEQFVAQVEKKLLCLQVALRQAGPDNLGQQYEKLTSWNLEILTLDIFFNLS